MHIFTLLRTLPRFAFTLVFTSLLSLRPAAQCSGDFVLATQTDADNFPACDTLFGNLTIVGPDVSSLSGLLGLRVVTGALTIVGAPNLVSLGGLDSLRSVGSLVVNGNAGLSSLAPLENLRQAVELIILGNPTLSNLDLTGLERADSTILIAENQSLTSVGGLGALTAGHRLVVSNNPALNACCDLVPVIESGIFQEIVVQGNAPECQSRDTILLFCSLKNCRGDVVFPNQSLVNQWVALASCPVWEGSIVVSGADVADLSPLTTLQEITGDLVLAGNPVLAALGSGLSNLKKIGGSVFVLGNPRLRSLDGLAAVENFSENLSIEGNDSLTTLLPASSWGFSELNSLVVQGNGFLKNFNGLENLQSIRNLLIVRENRRISEVNLPLLTSVGGSFILEKNDSLRTLDGMLVLKSVVQNLEIRNNPLLGACCALATVVTSSPPPDTMIFENNPPFCGSVAEIIADCFDATSETDAEKWQLHIFPNPAADFFNLEIELPAPDLASAELAAADGSRRLVFFKNEKLQAGKNVWQVNVGGVPPGVYFLQVRSAFGSRAARVIVN